jgi:proteasome lid subunit RPN8/RPN11
MNKKTQPINVKQPTEKFNWGWSSDIVSEFIYSLERKPLTNINGKKLILHQNALNKAVIYYAVTQKTQGSMEIMGWLAGKITDKRIEVHDAYIGNCNSTGTYTELDVKETIKLKKHAKKHGLVLLGQWHCHPGFSTSPSGTDSDSLNTMQRFGIKNPISLIVNDRDFWIGTIENEHTRRVEFVIPPKFDNKINLHLGFINGEYSYIQEPLVDEVITVTGGYVGIVSGFVEIIDWGFDLLDRMANYCVGNKPEDKNVTRKKILKTNKN